MKKRKCKLTKREKREKCFHIGLLICQLISLAILIMELIDNRIDTKQRAMLDYTFLGLFLILALEQIIRIGKFAKNKNLGDYWKTNKAEPIYLIAMAVIMPLSFVKPELAALRWVAILKLPNILRRFNDEKVFQVIAKSMALILILFFVVPFFNVVAVAISAPGQIVNVMPKNIDLFALKYVLHDTAFLRSVGTSIFVTVVGTLISVTCMTMAAYPLSKPNMPLKKPMMIFFLIVMLFSGGIAPNILLVNSLGLLDTIWALILPSVVMVYYLLLLKGFFESVPYELEESAKLDGASNFQVLFQVFVPMSKPMVATVSFFTAISYWNNINNSILYVTNNKDIYPLPMYIKNFLGQNPMEVAMNNPTLLTYWDGIKMSYILMSIIPIAIAYPFIFKYLKNDISAGAVKG